MKKLHRNLIVLSALFCFLGAAQISDAVKAQTRQKSTSPTPPKKAKSSPSPNTKTGSKTPTLSKSQAKTSPKKSPSPLKISDQSNIKKNLSKKSPTPVKNLPDKTIVKQTVKQTVKKTSSPVIVNVTSGRVRREPNTAAETVKTVALGTIFDALDKDGQWIKIKLSENQSGWISNTIVNEFNSARREKIYSTIADKYLKKSDLSFGDAAQIFEFLTRAARETNSGDLGLKRLKSLTTALRLIPSADSEKKPYKNFIDNNADKIVYSEPADAWFVRSNLFWELYTANKDNNSGEEIAWAAAENPTPGECEGYINCHLYRLRVTVGEYLNFYPNGKYSREALKTVTDLLSPAAADARLKQTFTAPNDITDRAEFNKTLAELRAIVAKLPFVEKQKTLQQISTIAEGYR